MEEATFALNSKLIIVIAVVGLAILATIAVLVLVLFSRRSSSSSNHDLENMTIDISQLPSHGPQGKTPILELLGNPVRIAVIVIAPAGRGSELPSKFNMPGVIDSVVPGLMEIVNTHEPIFRRWPQQLSVQGFVHSFFSNMELPGDRGKETPWTSIAGRVQSGGQSLLLGLVLCADESNNMGQFTAEHAGQWLDMLRIRR